MSFDNLLTNIQYMFNDFEIKNKLLADAQKIRLILQKIHSPRLTQVKNELWV